MGLFVLLCFVVLVGTAYTCEEENIKYGCRIHDRECLCGVGCDVRYRYKTREACLTALSGRTRDTCSRQPCKNDGICTQKVEDPGYSCHCASTGYYGSRCESKCPNYNNSARNGLPEDYPVDCIVI